MPSRNVALRQLGRLAGSWKTCGRLLAGEHTGSIFTGADNYRWLPGLQFLQHRWRVRMPDGLHQGIEILGYDTQGKTIFAHAYDGDGSFTASHVRLRGNGLWIVSDQLSFAGCFDNAGTMLSGIWSSSAGAAPVMEVMLRAAAARAGSG